MVIRPATKADTQVLGNLYIEFHEFHARGLPDRLRIPEPYDLDAIRGSINQIMANSTAGLVVAEDDDGIAGFAEVRMLPSIEPDPAVVERPRALLQGLYVREEMRGRGIGSSLIRHVEEWARAEGAEELVLNIWEFDARTLRFYEQLGFKTFRRAMFRRLGSN